MKKKGTKQNPFPNVTSALAALPEGPRVVAKLDGGMSHLRGYAMSIEGPGVSGMIAEFESNDPAAALELMRAFTAGIAPTKKRGKR